jgi:glycosyltransferase involved in cell wall biosynthesis
MAHESLMTTRVEPSSAAGGVPDPQVAPTVSVLMCTNRVDAQLFVALESISAQTLRAAEVVLVCNGLERAALERVSAWCDGKNVRVLTSRFRSLTNNLNVGLHHCSGVYVARMDADDVAYPERLEIQARYLEAHPEVGVCGTFYELIDEAGKPLRTITYPTDDAGIRRSLFLRNPICHPSAMFRRELVLQAGGYMGAVHSEDYDLWVRLALERKTRFANVPQVLLGYRAAPSGAARRAAAAYAGVAATQARAFLASGDPRWFFASLVAAAKRLLRAQR